MRVFNFLKRCELPHHVVGHTLIFWVHSGFFNSVVPAVDAAESVVAGAFRALVLLFDELEGVQIEDTVSQNVGGPMPKFLVMLFL